MVSSGDLFFILIITFGFAGAFLVFGIFLLYVRSATTKKKLSRIIHFIRNDAPHFLSMNPKNKKRRCVEVGIKKNSSRITTPPQFNRTLPPILRKLHDSKDDCAIMLGKIRRALRKIHGHTADLMSMRSCLSCVDGNWPIEEGERFLRVYERIVFGVFREGHESPSLSTEDIQFMKFFFYHKVMQEF